MVAKACAYEFQAKHFGFADAKASDFYHSQWFESRSIFVAFKAFTFIYSFIWAILTRMHYENIYPKESIPIAYLSNWGEWTMVVYFGVSLILAIYGLTLDSYTSGKKSDIVCCIGNKCNNGDLRWFHHLTWILFTTANGSLYLITIVYWAFIDSRPENNSDTMQIHQHAITTVLIVLDVFITRIPVRLLHFIHLIWFLATYCILTVIFYGTGLVTSLYPGILDWENSPGISAGVCVGLAIIGTPIFHAILFGFYHLRSFIARKVLPNKSKSKQNTSMDAAKTQEDVAMDTIET